MDAKFKQGVSYFKDEKFEQAFNIFLEIVSYNKKNHKAWNALGVTLSKLGNYAEINTCFENALFLDPKNLVYQKNLTKIQTGEFSIINKKDSNKSISVLVKKITKIYLGTDQEKNKTNSDSIKKISTINLNSELPSRGLFNDQNTKFDSFKNFILTNKIIHYLYWIGFFIFVLIIIYLILIGAIHAYFWILNSLLFSGNFFLICFAVFFAFLPIVIVLELANR